MVFEPAFRLGVSLFDKTSAVSRTLDSRPDDLETITKTTYRQVVSNAYVMESRRLTTAESQLAEGNLSVREFVRAGGKSEFYRSRYFEQCASYRFTDAKFYAFSRSPSAVAS